MGVDYDAVGGIGIRVTKERLQKLGYNEDDNDVSSFLDDVVGVTYSEYGSCYSENSLEYAWMVPGSKYLECVKNIPEFLKELNDKNLNVTEEDLEIIEEIFIW